ncbi:MAG: DUF429 domain-containing protein [Spirochaetaceae bacterium]|nr:MAG: DUF429 domain-containing protein [Spirochaetaceae bacterium]
MSVLIIGIDLSGPSNTADTVLTLFRAEGAEVGEDHGVGPLEPPGSALPLVGVYHGIGDLDILRVCDSAAKEVRKVVVGLDAPLSYNPGGGDRPADAALRKRLSAAGLKPATVMAPTMTRMAYLTLRGVAVARLLCTWASALSGVELVIYEVHPGGVMVLRGAAPEDVRALKSDAAARLRLCDWFAAEGTLDIGAGGSTLLEASGTAEVSGTGPASAVPSDHAIASCAAALGAWHASAGRPSWFHPPEPPLHPFAVCC